MDNNEINALIDKYSLIRIGDKVGTHKTRGIDKDAFLREVGPHKAEIIAYFEAQDKAADDLRAKRAATFEAIPGVAELRKARAQYAEWRREFTRMIEAGDGRMPRIKAPTTQEMEQLESKYPIAVFALQAESRAYSTVNAELSWIWKSTYNALCDGQDPKTVKANHDKRMSQYTEAHLWD